MKKIHSTGAKWEEIVGYSRAVRVGNTVEVSGTVAIQNGQPFAIGDAYAQTQRILEIISEALNAVGAQLADVTRTRTYVTDINFWKDVGRAHGEVFKDIKPATSLVEVSGLIRPEFLVEIEVTAVIDTDK